MGAAGDRQIGQKGARLARWREPDGSAGAFDSRLTQEMKAQHRQIPTVFSFPGTVTTVQRRHSTADCRAFSMHWQITRLVPPISTRAHTLSATPPAHFGRVLQVWHVSAKGCGKYHKSPGSCNNAGKSAGGAFGCPRSSKRRTAMRRNGED